VQVEELNVKLYTSDLNQFVTESCPLRKEILSISSGKLIKTGMRVSTTEELEYSQFHMSRFVLCLNSLN